MGSYVQQSLTKDEVVMYTAHPSWIAYALCIICTFGLALIYVFIVNKTTELALTNKRIIAKTGFISRNVIELRLEKVESIVVEQGVFGRLLGYGTILIRGTGGIGAPIKKISNPIEFKRQVDKVIDDRA